MLHSAWMRTHVCSHEKTTNEYFNKLLLRDVRFFSWSPSDFRNIIIFANVFYYFLSECNGPTSKPFQMKTCLKYEMKTPRISFLITLHNLRQWRTVMWAEKTFTTMLWRSRNKNCSWGANMADNRKKSVVNLGPTQSGQQLILLIHSSKPRQNVALLRAILQLSRTIIKNTIPWMTKQAIHLHKNIRTN